MNNTIYILTDGEYSDYHIIGAYSTLEIAERARFVYPGSSIEEYKLDDVPDYPPGMTAWRVIIYNENADNIYISQTSPYEVAEENIPSEKEYSLFGKTNYHVLCWAVDKEHAKKIALDKFYQHQAQKAGIA